MKRSRSVAATTLGLGLALAISGCTNPYDPGQRALGGAAIGAGTGAAIGALAGGGRGAAAGALIGGAVGAIGGAVTTPPPPTAQPYPPAGVALQAPEMVWLPAAESYVAVDYSYPFFFYGGIYYYLWGGTWYSGPSYRGPWHPQVAPPSPLRGFQPRYWNDYQARARTHYRADPRWRHFRAR